MPKKKKPSWRMIEPCETCPFASSEGGVRQRKALRAARWQEIKRGLLRGEHFWCHKTTDGDEEEDGSYMVSGNELVCAGAIEFQNKHRVSSQYVRVCERIYGKEKKMKILVHHHKYGDEYWDASTEEKEREALQGMFDVLSRFGCYTRTEKKQAADDMEALRRIVLRHKDREYENWELVDTRN